MWSDICGVQSCVSHVTTRLDSVAGVVLSAIFEATRRDETKVKMDNTGWIYLWMEEISADETSLISHFLA